MKRRNENVADANSKISKRQKLPKHDDDGDEFPTTSRENKKTPAESKKVRL